LEGQKRRKNEKVTIEEKKRANQVPITTLLPHNASQKGENRTDLTLRAGRKGKKKDAHAGTYQEADSSLSKKKQNLKKVTPEGDAEEESR